MRQLSVTSAVVVSAILFGALASCVTSRRDSADSMACPDSSDYIPETVVAGGGGADTIVFGDGQRQVSKYNAAHESPPGPDNADKLFNFKVGEDKIDIRNIDGDPDTPSVWVPSGEFAKPADRTHEARYTIVHLNARVSIVAIDVDGGGSDAEIRVNWHSDAGQKLSRCDIIE